MDRKSAAVTCRPRDALDFLVDASARIGDVLHIVAELLREQVVRVGDLMAQFVD